MKQITKYVAFDEKEFMSEEECKEHESNITKKIYKDFKSLEYITHSPIVWSNGYTDTMWVNIKSYDELKILHDWAVLEFDEHDSFTKDILNESFIGHWIYVEHNDYYISVYGTLEEYKDSIANFKII